MFRISRSPEASSSKGEDKGPRRWNLWRVLPMLLLVVGVPGLNPLDGIAFAQEDPSGTLSLPTDSGCREDLTGEAALTDDQACAANRIAALRELLAQAQEKYAAALGRGPWSPGGSPRGPDGPPEGPSGSPRELSGLPSQKAPSLPSAAEPSNLRVDFSPGAAQYLDNLRAQLDGIIVALIDHSTSSEARIAELQAIKDTLLRIIWAYEDHLGTGSGVRTTEWNILPEGKLGELKERVREDLVALETERARLPPSEVPSALRRRITELRGFYDNLEQESRERTLPGRPELPTIRKNISVAQARALFPQIAEVDGPNAARKHAERLGFHFELRRLFAWDDASLTGVSRRWSELDSQGQKKTRDLALLVKGGLIDIPPPGEDLPPSPSGNPRPPKLPPSGGRDPPGLVANLRAAAEIEQSAMMNGDRVLSAWARSWISREAGLLQGILRRQSLSEGDVLLLAHSDEQLRKLKERTVQQYKIVAVHPEGSPTSAQELLKRNDQIDKELVRRRVAKKGALRGPGDLIQEAKRAGRMAATGILEHKADLRFNQNFLLALKKLEDVPPPLQDQRISRLIPEVVDRALVSEGKLLEQAWKELEKGWNTVRLAGRGPEGAAAARDLLFAQEVLKSAASDLKERINKRGRPAGSLPIPLQNTLLAIKGIPAGSGKVVADPLVVAERALRSVTTPQPKQAFVANFGPGDSQRAGRFHLGSVDRFQLSDGYSKNFSASESWTRNSRAATEIFSRSPGGIIIEAAMPADFTRSLQEARINLKTGELAVKLSGSWRRVEPRLDIGTARAAWAYVNDERVIAISLSNLSGEQAPDPYGNWQSVELHPALVDTAVGSDLIRADKLITQLQLGEARIPGAEYFRNAYLIELKYYGYERKNIVIVSKATPFFKGDFVEVIAEPILKVVSAAGGFGQGKSIQLRRTSDWLNENKEDIRKSSPPLDRVLRFAAIAAIFRSVRQKGVRNNLDQLVLHDVSEIVTPRLLKLR